MEILKINKLLVEYRSQPYINPSETNSDHLNTIWSQIIIDKENMIGRKGSIKSGQLIF
jgi:hypothetical protein